jgi:hypothetical protein
MYLFEGAPEPLGFGVEGREVLGFVPGDVNEALPARLRTPELLASAAVLLRRLHDATAGFASGPDDRWLLPPRSPAGVVCHGDTAPYNCVVRDGRAVAFIDFDTAHPDPRGWDVAYAVYRFAPLHAPTNPDGYGGPGEQGRRAALFCRAYGRPAGAALLDVVAERLRALIAFMRAEAERGGAAFQVHVDAGHIGLYEADIAHLDTHPAPPCWAPSRGRHRPSGHAPRSPAGRLRRGVTRARHRPAGSLQ